MKKKNVVVMALDLSGEYTQELLRGINSFFADKEVNTILCQVKLPNLPYGYFEYQYWAGTTLIESKSIDAVIIVSSFFVSSVPVDLFSSWIRGLAGKPVVSIGAKLDLPNSCTLITECRTVFRELIKHLVEKHGCKKIAFMSANDTISEEARERFEAYKEMLVENNLPYDEKLVFDGNFTTGSAETAMSEFKSKEDIPFDAIVCANDLMAVGVYNAMAKIGVSVPEDLIVTGYDNSIHAHMIEPTMTTISTQIFDQGYTSAELIYKKMMGEVVEDTIKLPLKSLYRQSCGCVPKSDVLTNYITDDGEIVKRENAFMSHSLSEHLTNNEDKKNIYSLLDVLQVSETLHDLFHRFKQILFTVDIRRMAVVLYDEPVENLKNDTFVLPEEVELSLVLDRENEVEIISPGVRFNPHETILPENIFNTDFDEYVMAPIFFGEKQYGYFILKFGQKNYYQNNIYIKALCNAIASSFEYTKKQEENVILTNLNKNLVTDNDKLSETSKTDELTRVYNRRGFLLAGNQIMALTQTMVKSGTVFFCDIDGLKTINDQYGHHIGDIAIKCVARALRESFRLNDVIGRLGGDEFAVMSAEISLSQYEEKYEKVLAKCKALSKKEKLPFEVSVSIGAVEFTSRDRDLQALLKKADEQQYIVKKERKQKQLNK